MGAPDQIKRLVDTFQNNLDAFKSSDYNETQVRREFIDSLFIALGWDVENKSGYAEDLGIPVIYICEEERFKHRKTHFDTNHHLTVQWKDEPDSLKLFAGELKATIRATFPIEAKLED